MLKQEIKLIIVFYYPIDFILLAAANDEVQSHEKGYSNAAQNNLSYTN